MANEIFFRAGDASSAPLDDIVPVVLGAGALPGGTCRTILVETAGRVNVTVGDGTTVRANVPLQVGYNPIVAWAIDAPTAGTPPTGIFAGY